MGRHLRPSVSRAGGTLRPWLDGAINPATFATFAVASEVDGLEVPTVFAGEPEGPKLVSRYRGDLNCVCDCHSLETQAI